MNIKQFFRMVIVTALGCSALSAYSAAIDLTEDGVTKSCTTLGPVTISEAGAIAVTVSTGCLGSTGGGGGATEYTVNVTKNGSGSGAVVSAPAGIDCGATCSFVFPASSSLTLTATQAEGSNFVSWTGCPAPTGATCTISSLTSNRTIAATFSSQSTGGDPGPGTGVWKPDALTYVHDRGAQTELFVPRCVPTQYNNCRYGGTQSQYDSLKPGEVWSMRIPFAQDSSLKLHSFQVARAETGETLTSYDMSISTTPGNFNVASACFRASGGTITVYDQTAGTPKFGSYCPLPARNAVYYLNVRPAVGSAGVTSCGANSASGCRYRIVIPTGTFSFSQ